MPETQTARRTDKFRGQHDHLLKLAVELGELSSSIASLEDAQQARAVLSNLGGKLLVHLAMEDKSLYPQLLASGQSEVVSLTKQFMDEMGGLAEAFEAYNKRWAGAATILEQSDTFQTETAGIVAALGTRIDKENNQLYPMADAG